jgi:hypothetical protein
MANVDIFTTKWLAQQWCKGKCNYKGEDVCNPQFFAQGILGLGLNIRVTGKMPMSECPIACRVFPIFVSVKFITLQPIMHVVLCGNCFC